VQFKSKIARPYISIALRDLEISIKDLKVSSIRVNCKFSEISLIFIKRITFVIFDTISLYVNSNHVELVVHVKIAVMPTRIELGTF
jgi:hypothetical protein